MWQANESVFVLSSFDKSNAFKFVKHGFDLLTKENYMKKILIDLNPGTGLANAQITG